MRKIKNIVGQKFGKLLVVEYAGLIPVGKVKASAWICLCDCGVTVTVLNNNIKRGNTNSCGCLKKEIARKIKINLVGNSFGNLTVNRFIDTKDGNSIWECSCKCGNICKVTSCCLKNGQKSCGCKQGWWRSEKPGLWKNQAEYARWRREDPVCRLKVSVSNSIRHMLKNNGSYKKKKSIRNYLPYSIEELKSHIEKLWEPWMNWGNYGGKSNDTRRTWHIDHIKPHCLFDYKTMEDASFQECWSLSNLRPLEKKENMIKGKKFQ